jgi:acyl dehydratase
MRFFEDLEIGQRRELGSFTFTAELIKKFATQFDPQRFHLDEEAGRNSLFGGLAASGWHVGSVCMKLLVADGQRQAAEAAARGEKVAVWGPSPGFRELRWIEPVLAGDTISFASAIETLRTSEKRCSRCWRRPSCRGAMPSSQGQGQDGDGAVFRKPSCIKCAGGNQPSGNPF